MNQRNAVSRDIAAIEDLLRFWDPIDVLRGPRPLPEKAPRGEYDQYAPEILRLLSRGATNRELQLHLNGIRTGQMELQPNPDRDAETAGRLIAWWRSRNSE